VTVHGDTAATALILVGIAIVILAFVTVWRKP
jgi:LPXTG-motif cell wall-anchored protein